ncbi:MAG: nucleotidyltransferase family protein [Rectinemataceae bacterium]
MSIRTKTDLLDFLDKNRQVIKGYGISKIGLFGSFVRDQQTDKSDVDLLVEFEPSMKSYDNFIDLAFFLEEKIEREVELITVDALSPYIGPYILREVEYIAL